MTTSTEQPIAATNGETTHERASLEQFSPARRPLRRSTALDDFDTLAWRLQPQLDATNGVAAIFGVVAIASGAGSTTVAANLAQRLVAQVDGPVLLIDANLYRPKTERLFGLKKNPGLAEVLVDNMSIADVVQTTKHPGLDLLAAGRAGMLDQLGVQLAAFENVVNELRERYSAVVVDLPEASKLGPSLFLARQCDGVVLVAEADRTRRGDAEGAVQQLKLDGVPLMGSVLNRKRSYVPAWLERLL
jgi:Mrp family chromosome partitioning ATPase